MRYEVVQVSDGWVVRSSDGCELARYLDQDRALQDVADRLSQADASEPASLSVRYQARTA